MKNKNRNQNLPEVLAPAGNLEAFRAALNAHADAIYLGLEDFSARKRAKNFSFDDLEEVLDLAKRTGTKVYITVNTLIKDNELSQVVDFLQKVLTYSIDGLIIQDLGILSLLLKLKKEGRLDDISIQLSTQASVYGKEGTQFFSDLGLDRVVIARETGINEINDIDVGAEKKIFCHGALCYAYSGQCHLSSEIGGRSGNRGTCAQPCRQFYSLYKDDTLIKDGFLLSTKELNTLDQIERIKDSNIDSLKIEGRLRSPEYVYTVTKGYKDALNGNKVNHQDIAAVFNRNFTPGKLFYSDHNLEQSKSKKRGLLIGKTGSYKNGLLEIKLNKGVTVINGDGISFGENEELGTNISRIYNKKKETLKEGKNSIFIPFNKQLKPGTPVFRSFDKNRMDRISKEALKEPEFSKIPISFFIDIKAESFPIIKAKTQDIDVTIRGNIIPQVAQNRSLSQEQVIKQFSKLGNTRFGSPKFEINLEDGLFLSIKDLNDLRKQAVESLEDLLSPEIFRKESEQIILQEPIEKEPVQKQLFSIQLDDLSLLPLINDFDMDEVVLMIKTEQDQEELKRVIKEFKNRGKTVLLTTPTVLEDRDIKWLIESSILDLADSNDSELADGWVIQNFEILNLVKNKDVTLEAGESLNSFNRESVQFLKDLGLNSFVLSQELSDIEINELSKTSPLSSTLIIGGPKQLMISANCVMDCKNCVNCPNEGIYTLQDNRGNTFKLKISDKKNYLYTPEDSFISSALFEQPYVKKFRYQVSDINPQSLKRNLKTLGSGPNKDLNQLRNIMPGNYESGVL